MPSTTEFDSATLWRDGRPVYDRGDTVCVIGAGGSGLTAIKNLKEQGFGVDCYERDTSIGGSWNFRNDRSPVYASTHLISSKPTTEFPDFPMPDSWPDYPSHAQFLAYLERYADHFALRPHIWFGTEVVKVEPADQGGRWDVTTRSTGRGGSARTHRYAAVMIANGHNWAPRLPDYEGLADFRGQVIHAAAYKDPAQLRGKKVLVVGGGNTGCDIAVEAAQQAARCWHSTRRGYWYSPKYLLGRPTDQVNDTILAMRLPLAVREWLFRVSMKLTIGDVSRFGLAKPDHGPYESHPIINSQLVYYIGHGELTPVPDVARFHRHSVELADKQEIEPDLVVLASGYLPRFEFLDPSLLGIDGDGRPHLLLHAFAAQHPTLSVVGLLQPDSGLFSLVHWQTVAIARWLRLRAAEPSRAATVWSGLQATAKSRLTSGKVTTSSRHWFEVSHTVYLRTLQQTLDELEAVA